MHASGSLRTQAPAYAQHTRRGNYAFVLVFLPLLPLVAVNSANTSSSRRKPLIMSTAVSAPRTANHPARSRPTNDDGRSADHTTAGQNGRILRVQSSTLTPASPHLAAALA